MALLITLSCLKSKCQKRGIKPARNVEWQFGNLGEKAYLNMRSIWSHFTENNRGANHRARLDIVREIQVYVHVTTGAEPLRGQVQVADMVTVTHHVYIVDLLGVLGGIAFPAVSLVTVGTGNGRSREEDFHG